MLPHGSARLGSLSRLVGAAALAAALVVPLAVTAESQATPGPSRAAAPSVATVVTIGLDHSAANRGTRVTATGTVLPPDPTEARALRLQRAVPGGWATVATKVLPAATADYAFSVPTSFFGSFSYRVLAAATSRFDPGASGAEPLRVTPPYDPIGRAASHSFLAKPIARWDPCTKIHYRVNTRLATKGALGDVKKAITRIRQATGLPLVYDGRTSQVPTGKVGDTYGPGVDLVIAWARPGSGNMLGAGSTAAGVGGPIYSTGYEDGAGKAVLLIRRGGVVLNAKLNSRIRAGFGKGQTRGELVMHEVGHALGLGHTARGQIMYKTLQARIARFEAGDLAGLNRVGAQQGCVTRAGARVATRPSTASTP